MLTLPLWAIDLIDRLRGTETWFTLCSELLSIFPGAPGVYLRRGFYLMTLDAYAIDSSLGFGTTVSHRKTSIGAGVYIGNKCSIGQVIIKEHTTIGCNVDILSGCRQHSFDDLDRPIQEQPGIYQQIQIGKNCWLGNHAVVMADVGDDCIVGAASVVNKPLQSRSVVVGNPARVVKSRVAFVYPVPHA